MGQRIKEKFRELFIRKKGPIIKEGDGTGGRTS